MKPPASARGLFHATGKRPKKVIARLEDGTMARVDGVPREKNGFYPTPREPTDALVHAEREHLSRYPLIWEPACGDGAMMRDLERHGIRCIGSDLIDRGCGATIRSFLDFDDKTAPSKAIVTNPPFELVSWSGSKAAWIDQAMWRLGTEYMALLLPWAWPGAAGLGRIWAAFPPSRVYLMRWRIDFTGLKGNTSNHGWYVWDRAHTGETILRMMDRVDPAQASLFGGAPDA